MAQVKSFVTFGQAHCHVVGNKIFDKDCVAVIHHDSLVEGRKLAFECFGTKFCFVVPEKDFKLSNMSFFPRGFIDVNDPPADSAQETETETKKARRSTAPLVTYSLRDFSDE